MLKKAHIEEFVSKAYSKKIVLYGAGKRLENAIEFLKKYELYNQLFSIVDRNKKTNTSVEINNKQYVVINRDDFFKRTVLDDSYIFLITCADYLSISKDLIKNDYFVEHNFYSLKIMEIFDGECDCDIQPVPGELRKSEQQLIPKKIHYCWFGGKDLPDSHKRYIESWHKYCPDYEIVKWNEDNYDITKNKYMLQAYECKKWGFVPDYARLDIIYQYGGLYFDTDVEFVSNFDDLLYQDGFIGFETSKYINLGHGFGAIKGLEIIRNLRECYNDRVFVNKSGEMDLTTSPRIQTEYLKSVGLVTNGMYQYLNRLTVYPAKMFAPKSLITGRVNQAEYTKSIHHFEGSWVNDDIKERNKEIYEFWKENSYKSQV